MLVFSLCLCALFSIILSECPSNSVKVPCPNPVKRTCGNLYDSSKTMILKCIPDCECIPSYVFTPDGIECMRIEDCKREDIKCPDDQEYRECGIRNVCGKNNTSTNCKPGCFCKNDLFFSYPRQDCVDSKDCYEKVEALDIDE